MKEKIIKTILITTAFLTLSACGSTNEIQNTEIQEEVVDDAFQEEISELPPEELQVEESDDTYEFNLDENSDVQVSITNNSFCTIKDNGKEIKFTCDDFIPEITAAYKMDFDHDGEEDYVMLGCAGRGTGVYIMDLLVVKDGIEKPVYYYSGLEIGKLLDSRLKYQYEEAINYLIIGWDDADDIWFSLDEANARFESASVGDILYIEKHTDGFWVTGSVSLYFDNVPWAQYEPTINYAVSLEFTDDMEMKLGIVSSKQTSTYDEEKDLYLPGEMISECYRDVTHDGIEDKILISVAKDFTLKDVLSGVTDGVLNIYEGYVEGYSEKYSSMPILQRSFGTPHVGNGQMFLTTIDGIDYLVETDFWAGQGTFTYQYKVFFAGFFDDYVIEVKNCTFEFVDEPVDTTEFFNELNKWINDTSVILYAADIDHDPSLIYYTNEIQVNPEEYLIDKQ